MAKLKEFKDEILKKYDSESAFARDLDWPRQKVNQFTTGSRVPDIADAWAMSDKLSLPIADMIGFFLPTE